MAMDNLRAEFESKISHDYGDDALLKNSDGDYLDWLTADLWDYWQASRASIVVELPEPHAHLIWIQAGHAPDDYWDDVEVSRSEKDKCCDGSDRYPVYAEHEISEAIRSIGISIKGD